MDGFIFSSTILIHSLVVWVQETNVQLPLMFLFLIPSPHSLDYYFHYTHSVYCFLLDCPISLLSYKTIDHTIIFSCPTCILLLRRTCKASLLIIFLWLFISAFISSSQPPWPHHLLSYLTAVSSSLFPTSKSYCTLIQLNLIFYYHVEN